MKNKILSWFIGFCDAEANFQTTLYKRLNKENKIISYGIKYSFHMGLHERDLPLLEYIRENLNSIGKIYHYSEKKECHLNVNKIEELSWLIKSVFNVYPLLTKHQSVRFNKIKQGILENIKTIYSLEEYHKHITLIPEVNVSFDSLPSEYLENWIVGFLNGEVSFTTRKPTDRKNRSIPLIYLEHTDETVLYLIKNYLNLGPSILSRQRDLRKKSYILNLSSKKDLLPPFGTGLVL